MAAILESGRGHRDTLQALALAGPRSAWIGAGFVRNAVWDALSGISPDVSALADLDVLHLDGAAADAVYEAALRQARPALPWSVANQARMARRHGHPPYPDIAGAMLRWPETATAIAARLAAGRIEVLAPFGLGDLFDFVLRTPPGGDGAMLAARASAKRWRQRWPRLRLIGD